MKEEKLKAQESLEIISQMVSLTKAKMEKRSVIPFFIWGYSTVLISLLVWYFITKTHNYQWNLLWLLIPIIGYLGMFLFGKKKTKEPKTYIDKIIAYIWIVFGFSGVTIGLSTFFFHIPILFITALIMSMATAITSLILQQKMMTIISLSVLMGSFLLLTIHNANQILAFGGLFFVLMVLPAHFLHYKNRKENV